MEQAQDARPEPASEALGSRSGASKTFRASEWILVILSFFFTVLTFPVSVWLCIKIVSAFERAVFLRLGHMRKGQAEGPGMYFVLPCTDTVITVDMRTKSFYIPLQEILTKDPVTVDVDGVIYYRVQDAILAVTNVTNADSATLLLAETTLRNVLGTNNFSQIVSNREKIAQSIKSILDNATGSWGVTVEHVEIRDVKTTVKVMAAEAGKSPPRTVKEASIVITESPMSLQFRCLQKTEDATTSHQSSTIVFTYP
ncbi:stomatin-like [Varanus komodoensis]|uniref:stomatin-like n=1 Tax=Varanus komodoensis TaxID=61221 RepID=UPI001CF7DAA4|nr:stomatin-like [Varanus komodoensis]